jgi:hypothetical protein
MGTAYFMTDEQLKAKNWDMLQEAKTLRGRKASLEYEWGKYAASWSSLARAKDGFTIQFEGKDVVVLNPSQKLCEVERMPQAHFDIEAMKRLRGELEETATALGVIQRQLQDLGVGGNEF